MFLLFAKGDLYSRDMAKVGQLLLSRGEWRGKRIVSAKWLEESLKPRFQPEPQFHYGYQWWIGSSRSRSRKIDWFEAHGLGSQRIIELPSSNAVVVFTTGLYFEENPGTTELLEIDHREVNPKSESCGNHALFAAAASRYGSTFFSS